MNLDLPDAALFSMDEPPRSMDEPKLASGGVLEVCMDDNMLAAEHHKELEHINDRKSWRKTVLNETEPAEACQATHDADVGNESGNEGRIGGALQKPAAKKPADSEQMLQDVSTDDAQSKNNVLPFKRHRAPRL